VRFRLFIESQFTYVPGSTWKFGSKTIPSDPARGDLISPPFPTSDVLAWLKKNRYEAERDAILANVPVQSLYRWQGVVEMNKLAGYQENHDPIKVYQFNGHLVIMNGNHRATAAFVEGEKYIRAYVTNFDLKKNFKYRKDKPTRELPLVQEVRPI
jgi:hypothetical protein